MIGLIVCAVLFFGLGFIAIPPLRQSIKDKSKPLIWFCIANMLGMWAIGIAFVIRIFTI
jgi:hypothetical protein